MASSEPNDFWAADAISPGTGTESDTNLEELSGSYSASDDFSDR